MATASALVYPLTYFITIMFYERYGKNRTFELVNFAVFSLVFMGVLFAFASTFDVYGGADGLEKIFNTDFRIIFSSVVSFIVGQYVMIRIYDFLGNKKGFDFLIAGVIAITIDSFLFVGLGYLGTLSFGEVLKLATGQYALNVIAVIIYSLCFNSLIVTLLKSKEAEEVIELAEPKTKEVKRAPRKSAATKKTTTKKAAPKKVTATKTTKTKNESK